MAYSIAKHYESFISALHKTLVDFFGKDNVIWMKNERCFRVRPMWIPGAGPGYKPDMSSCVNMTLAVMNKFNESYNYSIKSLRFMGIPAIAFSDSTNPDNGTDYICYVSVHHAAIF